MAVKLTEIPLTSDNPFFAFSIRLTGIQYTFHVRWNDRAGRWFFDLHTGSDTPLISSVPMLIERNLIGRFVQVGLPPGMLFVWDNTQQDSQPGRNAWGASHTFYYAEFS